MASIEGLVYVEEERLPQDRLSMYTGFVDERNQRKGIGKKVYANGDIYEGAWANDMFNGQGRFDHADGDVYEGFWKNSKAHGQGIYISRNGSCYIGEWFDDKCHG